MNSIDCIWWADTNQKSPCHSLELQSMFVDALPYNQRKLVKLFHLTKMEKKLLDIIFDWYTKQVDRLCSGRMGL